MDCRYFSINDSKFPYFQAPGEKTVEIPLGIFFINNFGFGITEIGNNMSNYNYNCAEVYNIESLPDLTNKNVLSISTINTTNILNKIISEANNFLLTWKFTNNELDDYLFSSSISYLRMENVKLSNKWVKNNLDGELIIVTNLKTLLNEH